MNDLAFLIAENQKRPTDPPPPLISGYVEGHRVLPTNTPFPGAWENSRTPYLIEIMDNMSPFNPTLITSVMKGAQIGVTAAAENVMGYWMDPNPTEVLYVSATDGLLEKWATKRLEPLIDSIGMRDKIFAQVENTKSRRTGDKMYSKEYVGGNLNMASAQSASGLRSDSKRVLILDEVDGAPRQLRTGEGNWLDVVYARTNAWGARKKILEFSTPTTFEESLIKERYEAGDRRKYKVYHPCCHVLDSLEFENLRHEMRAGQLYRVWYECPHCKGELHNYQKSAMMDPANGAHWEPTAIATSRGHRSYHISSMYSPVGMMSWFELYQKYLDSQHTTDGVRSFTNLYLGLPFKETGSRPKLGKVLELRGDYQSGEVQDGVLFITIGIDVQQGSEKDPENPPRLELEAVGFGKGYRTWSLCYKVFPGDVNTSAHSGAWEDLNQWAENGGLSFKRSDGHPFPTNIVFIDSGDGNWIDIVYSFTQRWGNTFPSKGFSALKKQKHEKGDEVGPHNFKRYRAAKMEDVVLYEISTNFYKTQLYNNLKVVREPIGMQRPGFCNFPVDYTEKYFKMLTAEEKRSDGSFHAGGRRNEAMDCRVMAMCAADVYLDAKVASFRAAAKSKGASEIELAKINHMFILDLMEKQTAIRCVA